MSGRRSQVSCSPRDKLCPPAAPQSAPVLAFRSCGCARRFVPSAPQHSQSAPVLARRRSRSSTSSSCQSVRSPSSGRNTPSPAPRTTTSKQRASRLKERAMSESHLAQLSPPPPPSPSPEAIRPEVKKLPKPVYFSTSLVLRIGSDRRHTLEQLKYEMRYSSEPEGNMDSFKSTSGPQFRTELEFNLENQCAETDPTSNQT